MDNEEVRLASGLRVMSAEPGDEVNGKVPFGVSGEWDAKTPDEAGLVAKAGAQTITGVKTFAADALPLLLADGSDANHPVRKSQLEINGDISGTLGNVVVNTVFGGQSLASVIDAHAPGGDVSGSIATVSVDKLKGVSMGTVAATRRLVLAGNGTAIESLDLVNQNWNQGLVTATYDFASKGGAQGTIGLGVNLPANAVVTKVWYGIFTAFTSGGSATVAVGFTGDTGAFVSSAAFDNAKYAQGWHDGVQTGGAANFKEIGEAAKEIAITIGEADLTAGEFDIYCEYFTD